MATEKEKELELIHSWSSKEQLEELTRIDRYKQRIVGIVRSIKVRETREEVDGKYVPVKKEILIVALPNGVTGYCPGEQFSIREYRGYSRFVGQAIEFYIDKIDLQSRILVLNGKTAQEAMIEELWEQLEMLQEKNALSSHRFNAVVSGVNETTRTVHVRVHGKDCFITPAEWSWNRRDSLNIVPGEEIEVVVRRFDKENGENGLVEVSRRLTLPDPYAFLEKLKVGDLIAGVVSTVDPINGIFVELESGLDVKASRIKELEEPVVGERVSCRVMKEITRRNHGRVQGRVLIIGYPNGKRTRRDLGDFLFNK
ncbi:30S ribosomal protein S1 [Lysinibacillus sp. CNPSo 3705]|uniref:30S ribosomal protein S1 n=1 Tax=Lysinibacillus sp. CNPSo 3705 TaxID=3028148 RepID=UPI002363B7FB|nr:30S ribosomal protein S1 [Lysinibacillus sp. CNPSo 3705]MDD1505217.1 30S ribosomal protein S1 [Lysinibacillus sp. CNPSo 3705]